MNERPIHFLRIVEALGLVAQSRRRSVAHIEMKKSAQCNRVQEKYL